MEHQTPSRGTLPRNDRPTGRVNLDLKTSSRQRTLCADGTVPDRIVLVAGSNGRELTDAKLEEWVAGFPIEVDHGRRRPETITAARSAWRKRDCHPNVYPALSGRPCTSAAQAENTLCISPRPRKSAGH
jgi:hypothetical protein